MTNSNLSWTESLGYVPWITLDPNPTTYEDFWQYIEDANDNLGSRELTELLRQLLGKGQVLFDKVKDLISKKTPITKTAVNKIWRALQPKASKSKKDLLITSKTSKKKKKTPGKSEKKLSPERIKECEEWLSLPDREKYQYIRDILGFYIKGEKELQQTLAIFFLKLGDVLDKDLISKVDTHGDPSSGKSYKCNIVVKLFPNENYIALTNASPKALLYDPTFNEDVKFIYLKELTKDNKPMIELLKALYDGDVNYIVTNFQEFDVERFDKFRTGQLTTYSFEYTQRDAIDRSWVFIPDQSHKQNRKVIEYRINRRRNRIKYDYEERLLLPKISLFKDIIRVLRDKPKVNVQISYLEKLKPLFSEKILRVRRDIDKLPDLIEIIARFNQNNRLRTTFDGITYIFAEYEDLEFVLDIALESFIEISQNIDGVQKDILEFMDYTKTPKTNIHTLGKALGESDKWYILKEIYEYVSIEIGRSIHSNTIRNKLVGLSKNGYIEIKEEGRGKPKKYKKLKDIEKTSFPLEDYKEEFKALVEQAYNYWKDIKPEIMGEGLDDNE